jgi:hypothetical protein
VSAKGGATPLTHLFQVCGMAWVCLILLARGLSLASLPLCLRHLVVARTLEDNFIGRKKMGRVKEHFIEKLGQEAMENEMSKKQAPQLPDKLEPKVCLSTDDYFKKQWDEAELIVNKLKVSLQYPADAPENLDRPETFESIESYKKWAKNLYCLASDLADIAEHLEVLGNDNGQIESNYQDAQQADDFQGYDKPSDFL